MPEAAATGPQIPAALVRAGAAGRLTIVVGPSASRQAGIPATSSLLRMLLDRAMGETPHRGELEQARSWFDQPGEEREKATLLALELGEAWLRSAVARELAAIPAQPTDIHRALAEMQGARFLTVSPDRLLEQAIADKRGEPPRIWLADALDGQRLPGPGDVVKLGGDVEQADSLSFGTEHATGHGSLRKQIEPLTAPPYEMLLVAFDAGDELRECLSRWIAGDAGPQRDRFWLVQQDVRAQAWARASGLRPVWLGDRDTAAWLRALGEEIQQQKAQVPVLVRPMADGDATGPFREVMTLLGLGENLQAREALAQLSDAVVAQLPPPWQAYLAEALAQLGHIERAEAILAAAVAQARSPEEQGAVDAAHELVAVLKGQLPEGEPRSPAVRLHLARALLDKGDLARAAEHAVWLVEGDAARGDPPRLLFGLEVLVAALKQTIFEEPPGAQRIPLETRERVIAVLETALDNLLAVSLPPALHPRAARVGQRYARMASDIALGDRFTRAFPIGNEETLAEDPATEDAILTQAEHMADSGHIEDALAMLNRSAYLSPKWVLDCHRVSLLLRASKYERALAAAQEVARTLPGHVLVEALVGILFIHFQRFEEALPHIQQVFKELPVPEHRLALGFALLQTGQANDAWKLLSPCAAARNPEFLKLRAMIAEQVAPDEAPALWARYIELHPDDLQAKMRLAFSEQRVGHPERAAEIAWEFVTGPGHEQLDAATLYNAATLQIHGELAENARQRLRFIAEALRSRFLGDERAARFRLMLLAALGEGTAEPAAAQNVEPGKLLRDAMLVVGAATQGYAKGQLPFEALADHTGTPPASLFEQIVKNEVTGLPSLSPALDLIAAPPASFADVRLLAGPLEVCLIQKLHLWGSLRKAFAGHGKLVLFQDTAAAIAAAGIGKPDDHPDTVLARAVEEAVRQGLIDPSLERPSVPRAAQGPPKVLPPVNAQESTVSMGIARYLGYPQALANDGNLLGLCADFFMGSRYGGPGRAAVDCTFPSAQTALSPQERWAWLSARMLSLPILVRGLLPEYEAREKLLLLAELGFVDSLSARDIHSLSRQHGKLDGGEPERLLDRLERLARQREHFGANDAQARIAALYAEAIWMASCGDNPWPESESRALATSLLGRAEKLDNLARSNVLATIFEVLGRAGAAFPAAATVQTPQGERQFSDASRVGRLWRFIASWAASGRRRAALARGLRRVWLLVDELTGGEGPVPAQGASPLLLATAQAWSTSQFDAALGTLAVLSATWREKDEVFATSSVQAVAFDPDQTRTILVREILREAAELLAQGGARLSDEAYDAPISVPDSAARMVVRMPPEAALLRTDATVVTQRARELAVLQGLHDGRAYERLIKLADDPANAGYRKQVAVLAATAPWRIVREDPAVLLSWSSYRVPHFPEHVEQLREVLSEPLGNLPAEKKAMSDILGDRLDEGKEWAVARRQDGWLLFERASRVPGSLPSTGIGPTLDEDDTGYSARIAEALLILDHSDDCLAPELAGAIFLLRTAAEHRRFVRLAEGQVDLRERLPERLVSLLDILTVKDRPTLGTLASMEAGLLRLARAIVARLDGAADLAKRDSLWLTYRLSQWIVAQLRALPPAAQAAAFRDLSEGLPPASASGAEDDLLDPLGFDATQGIDYRLVTVLFALSAMTALARDFEAEGDQGSRNRWYFASRVLELRLGAIATRPFTAREQRVRLRGSGPTCLDWEGSGACPDLALDGLLQMRSEAFFDMPAAERLRWILDLPSGPDDRARAPWLVAVRLFSALAARAGRLSTEEARAYEQRLRGLQGELGSEADEIRWRGLGALFAARRDIPEDEIQRLLLERLDRPSAPVAFGLLLVGVGRRDPDRIPQVANRVLDAAIEKGIDPVGLAPGIGRLMLLQHLKPVQQAEALLRALAARPPYQHDPRMRSLLGTYGIR